MRPTDPTRLTTPSGAFQGPPAPSAPVAAPPPAVAPPALWALAAVPPQADRWSCGPNAAARALAALGRPVHDYAAFRGRCPQTFGPQTPLYAHPVVCSSLLLWVARNLVPEVGPHPHLLSAFLGGAGAFGAHSEVSSHPSFPACAQAMAAHLGRGGVAIALWTAWDATAHYVLVTGLGAPAGAHRARWQVVNGSQLTHLCGSELAARMDATWCPWRGYVGIGRFTALLVRAAAPPSGPPCA